MERRGRTRRAAAWLVTTGTAFSWTLPTPVQDADTAFGDVYECVHWQVPGKLLFYKDTVVHPISISLPAEIVATRVPRKSRLSAPFLGSRRGGDTSEFMFGALDEDTYHAMYARSRFAATRKKGGWDALRHAEILANGAIPVFEGLDEAPEFIVHFLPRKQILDAQRDLMPYTKRLEAAYNATVLALLAHTRRCLTAEAMAAHVLKTLGLWPVRRPLNLLYVTCGWGWQSLDDGWQGPVSIGLFLGLHLLLRGTGTHIVDAPRENSSFLDEHTQGSRLWYTFESDPLTKFKESNLRRLMYGYGFSYARKIPRKLMTSAEERSRVPADILKRRFDAVIYGKVGPAQGCDPLPYMDEVSNAGYPPQRVALIYGGDFGLSNTNISKHLRLFGTIGTPFVREIATSPEYLIHRTASVFPPACHFDSDWRNFFKLWKMRLACWGCKDIDAPIMDSLWPILKEKSESKATGSWKDGYGNEANFEHCWSGLALLVFPLLTQVKPASTTKDCDYALLQVEELDKHSHTTRDFREEFGIGIAEVQAFVCSACAGKWRHKGNTDVIQCRTHAAPHSDSDPFAVGFDAGVARHSLADLRMLEVNVQVAVEAERGAARYVAKSVWGAKKER